MGIRRVVPDLPPTTWREPDSYTGRLGFDVGMDLGWVVTLVSPTDPTAQIILSARAGAAPTRT